MNAQQRARMKEVGKSAFVREEMTRLGYWPPSPEVAEMSAEAEALLRPMYEELIGFTAAGAVRDRSRDFRERQHPGPDRGDPAQADRARARRARGQKGTREKAQAEKKVTDAAWRRETLPFLGHGVSVGLRYAGEDTSRS